MNDKSFNLIISNLFRYGIRVVGVLLIIGWVSSINFTENVFLQYQTYQQSNLIHDLSKAWMAEKWGMILAYLGLAILICLPALRVVFTTVLFARRKEYKMMGVTLLVLFGLILSVLTGIL